jgi:FkbM family methyltransferase
VIDCKIAVYLVVRQREQFMSMKTRIIQGANSLLTPFGASLVRTTVALDMSSAIQRIAEHDIPVRSIIDIGASDGSWSVNVMRTFPRASFLAVEPLRERQGALETLKQKHANFDYLLCVAGDKDAGEATLVVSEDLDGSTVDGSQGGKTRIVPSRTIDSIVAEKDLPGPFLLKFDTHGYEVPILLGAKDTLAKTNVIIMEVYNFKITDHALRFHETCSHMEGLGFRCYDIADPMLRHYDKAFWQMDILFARSDSAFFSYSQYR